MKEIDDELIALRLKRHMLLVDEAREFIRRKGGFELKDSNYYIEKWSKEEEFEDYYKTEYISIYMIPDNMNCSVAPVTGRYDVTTTSGSSIDKGVVDHINKGIRDAFNKKDKANDK